MKTKRIFFTVMMLLLIGILPFVQGCRDDDDESIISVCNNDNHDYVIKLHRYSDGIVVGQFDLDDIFHLGGDRCREFKGFRDGEYYITIHRDGQAEPTDTSGRFYIEEGEVESFSIDDTGDIVRRT